MKENLRQMQYHDFNKLTVPGPVIGKRQAERGQEVKTSDNLIIPNTIFQPMLDTRLRIHVVLSFD